MSVIKCNCGHCTLCRARTRKRRERGYEVEEEMVVQTAYGPASIQAAREMAEEDAEDVNCS